MEQIRLPIFRERKPVLTAREMQVVALLTAGIEPKTAAAQMGIAIKTLRAHQDSIRKKTNIRNLALLTRYAIKQGIA